MGLENKNIILISPSFFNYDYEIKKELERQGANVFLYSDRPSDNIYVKIIIRLCPKALKYTIHRYYKIIASANKKRDIDYIFFIKCESALPDDLSLLKNMFPSAKMILYLWDSICHIKYFDKKKKFFDTIYTFDDFDFKRNQSIKFLPLFFIPLYEIDKQTNMKCKYDISFMGTMHSDRSTILLRIKEICESYGFTYFFKLYVQNKFMFMLYYITKRDFRKLWRKSNIIIFNKQSALEISNAFKISNCVLDLNHPSQEGLTMRTIEIMGLNKKIITTNLNIKKYRFYKDDMISIIHRDHIILDSNFIKNESDSYEKKERKRYTIETWCKTIFDNEEGEYLL